jgi:hypothetical protein
MRAPLLHRSGLACAATALALVLVGVPPAVSGASVGAKGPNPCTLLKPKEISKALGQTTAKPTKGLNTPITKTCIFKVSAGNGQPEGELVTIVQTTGAKIAYDALSTRPGMEHVAGIAKSFYDPRTGTVNMLVGPVLLGVQSVFISTEGHSDRKTETTALAKIAKKRL